VSRFEVIPSLDLLDGKVVRLRQGDFATATIYGEPEAVLDALEVPRGSRLHIVDLEGSRRGAPVELRIVTALAKRDLRVQVGGGIRSVAHARQWLEAGASRLVVGTIAADSPHLLSALVTAVGAERLVAAVDVRDGIVKVAGWERDARASLAEVLRAIEETGITEILVTDISRDGVMRGPAFDLYRELRDATSMRVIASGGVSTVGDVVSLSRISNVSSCVIGRALLDRQISLRAAIARVALPDSVPQRVIPCLDVRDGRVVKGVSFEQIRDAGDPVECARRYEAEGADELVVLDISATERRVDTAIDTVRRIAEELYIPLTVGGGVRTVEDFRGLLRAGADRVAINTAAITRPELIRECAAEFGVQAVVLSCDARRLGTSSRWEAMGRSGRDASALDAVDWCVRAESLGAGEILLTSVDRDGTQEGFDVELLRAVTGRLKIGVIASGGAGRVEHFRSAIESGGASAVLAASLFHDRRLTIGAIKQYLAAEGIAVRESEVAHAAPLVSPA
jgi:cyclase